MESEQEQIKDIEEYLNKKPRAYTHPKKTCIFDYDGRMRSIELKSVDIIAISVTILSGDETIDVYYEDGTVEHFDSCDTRTQSFFDGNYVVMGDKLKKWYKYWDFLQCFNISYRRQEEFAE